MADESAPTRGGKGRGADYERLLREFGADSRPAIESVRFLMEQGYSRGQARNAVYRHRQRLQEERRRPTGI